MAVKFDQTLATRMVQAHVKRLHSKMQAMGADAVFIIEQELVELTKNAMVAEHGLQNNPEFLAELTDDAAKQMVIDELALFGLRCAIATLPQKPQPTGSN